METLKVQVVLGNSYKILTPEVKVGTQFLFLIQIDNEVVGFTHSKEFAKAIISSLATRESQRMTDEWTKILREDLKDGEKVVLAKQKLGRIYNSYVTPTMVIDFIQVPYLKFTKQELPKEDVPPPPPLPSQEVLENICAKRAQVTATPESEGSGSGEEWDSDTSEDSDYIDEEEEIDD